MATKTKVQIKPLGDRVLVQRLEAETKTASGIFLPDSAAEKPQQAKVIAVGEGKINEKTGDRIKPDVKAGDTIVLGKWGGTEIKIEDETYIVVDASEILAVVD